MSNILLATLGGQPQIITFALDTLLAMGEPIDEVTVIYLSRPRINQSLATLSNEFVDNYYKHGQRACRFNAIPLRDNQDSRLTDIQTSQHAIAVSDMLLELVAQLKAERHQLHLFAAGGRRLMALALIPIAQLHFGYEDKLWHIYTPDAFKAQAKGGGIMHAEPSDGVRLIQVPLLPLGVQFPALKDLATLTQPSKRETMPAEERQRCQTVWDNLTKRPREVLRLIALGATPEQVAEELHIVGKTVQTHQGKIFTECRLAWQFREDERLTYHFIQKKFHLFFE